LIGKSKIEENGCKNVIHVGQNDILTGQNDIHVGQNDIHVGQNDIFKNKEIFNCIKCLAKYKSKKRFDDHTKKCNGVDSFTCPKCMQTFKFRGNKSRHIKQNNCKPVSIFEYIKRQNEKQHITINNINNNTTNNNNITNNTFNNNITNIHINNYGKERVDYIMFDDFLKILKCCNDTIIPKYIKLKHFNPLFPENHNIKYKDNIFFIKTNDEWTIINSNLLSNKLYDSNGSEIYYTYNKLYDKIKDTINDNEQCEEIENKIDYGALEVKGQDKNIKKQIIDVVKTSKMNI
jgi:hypothetical protein